AQLILDTLAPYPSDSAHLRYPSLGRFSVFQVSETMYCIEDHEYEDTLNGPEEFPQWMYLGVEHLENPAFCISEWYAYERAQRNHVPAPKNWENMGEMGNVYAESIEKCLDIGGPYPGDCFFELEPGSCQFIVTQAGKETYHIWDPFRDTHLDLPSKLLKIRWFDLVRWCKKQLAHSYRNLQEFLQ
ncbi:hypothetical protein L218DRAFT_801462, partial [Marasmius fiardii PR-910]